jgi:hypothetical protein
MINVGLYVYTDAVVDLSNELIKVFNDRVTVDSGTLESGNCLFDITQDLGGLYGTSFVAKRVEFFDDEKISVTSSIQNINDISKTYTDFSQTFTIPATKTNNIIFKHWYENSLDVQFSTLKKTDAYIELDTIPFRVGKIQLESAVIKDNFPQSYSITFIGSLGTLKDKFAGLFLKDLTSTEFNEAHNGVIVRDKVAVTEVSSNLMYPLISSLNYWTYNVGTYDIHKNNQPIYYTDLFPALRLQSILKMIQTQFNINFTGDFLNNNRFKAAYLWLKNAEKFTIKGTSDLVTWDYIIDGFEYGYTVDLDNDSFTATNDSSWLYKSATLTVTPTVANFTYFVETYRNGIKVLSQNVQSIIGAQTFTVSGVGFGLAGDVYTIKISAPIQITFQAVLNLSTTIFTGDTPDTYIMRVAKNIQQTTSIPLLGIANYMPEIKIEDFFTGMLKMFNLTCHSSDGYNFKIETLENFYAVGEIVDITEFVKTDAVNLSRVQTYKKINFQYEKSESLVNAGFLSANGIEYGNLNFDTNNDGAEYTIKLPFEDLNFNNLKDKLQVGYSLKTDFQKYIPKPIILYDYNQLAQTNLVGTNYHFSTGISGNGLSYLKYKPFGQELLDSTNTYSLNFNEQQSTITNVLATNSLYNVYYSNYIENIFNYKARLVKVETVLPISILTTLKLNDRVIIRDKRYLINSFTTDLTTGFASFELLTDLRDIIIEDPYANFITTENLGIIETENFIKLKII